MEELNQKIIADITKKLSEKLEITFLVGAGISADRNSKVPTWGSLVEIILTNIAGKDKKIEIDYVMNNNKLLLNEVIFKLISDILGIKNTAKLLKSCFDTKCYNNIHYQLAYLSKNYHTSIITTNFDELIEEASKNIHPNIKIDILKVHGTVGDMENARFTIENLFEEFKEDISNQITSKLNNKTLVVMGYRGADSFDLIPLLNKNKESIQKIYWFTRDKENIETRLSEDFSEDKFLPIQGIFDNYLDNICDNLKIPKIDQKMLISHQEPNWWEIKISDFFNKLSEQEKILLPYLWAKILEHVKAYQLNENKEEYAVINAYESFLTNLSNLSDKEQNKYTSEYYYSRAHLLYAKRIIGIDVSDDFPDLISDIESQLINKDSNKNSKELMKLLGWIYHQFGISLQGKNKFYQAKFLLSEACIIRSKLNDPEYAFSLFQLFMNGYHATNKIKSNIDDLSPIGWRNWIFIELEIYSDIFIKLSKPDLYSTNIHNIGFLYQYLANENYNCIEMYLNKALFKYKEALEIRKHLRDERLIAQSYIRISQCYLELINVVKDENRKEKLVIDLENYLNEVHSVYRKIPQEEFRCNDLKQLKNALNSLKGKQAD